MDFVNKIMDFVMDFVNKLMLGFCDYMYDYSDTHAPLVSCNPYEGLSEAAEIGQNEHIMDRDEHQWKTTQFIKQFLRNHCCANETISYGITVILYVQMK